MKTLSIRELRSALPELEKVLALEGEVAVTRHGRLIARLVPVDQPIVMPSLAELRNSMPYMNVPSEVLSRQERYER